MSPQVTELERAIAAFRREHAVAYLKHLAGQPPEPRVDTRARSALLGERMREQLLSAREDGALTDPAYAAIVAQLARAELERSVASARAATSALSEREVSVEGDTRRLGALLGEWGVTTQPGPRARLLAGAEPTLIAHAERLLEARGRGDRAVATLLSTLSAPRHADAGPEGGGLDKAEAFLTDTAELTREALAYAKRALAVEGATGEDHLWIALGQPFFGLFSREARFRRLATDWAPLGLRRMLTARGRAALDHSGPFAAPHVVVLAAPHDVRVSASAAEHGLASELASAEAVGRALGVAHASEALPPSQRYVGAASVARAVGSLALLRLGDPTFLRRVRGLSVRESDAVARVARAFYLIDARLAAAAVLARRLVGTGERTGERAGGRSGDGASSIDEAAALAERALLGPAARATALLVLRLSPGAPFRAKLHGPALAWALREQFDEDWYLNPRASEPLHGALAQGGTLPVEQRAEQLGTDVGRGLAMLAELF
jgi:hypothetical protein